MQNFRILILKIFFILFYIISIEVIFYKEEFTSSKTWEGEDLNLVQQTGDYDFHGKTNLKGKKMYKTYENLPPHYMIMVNVITITDQSDTIQFHYCIPNISSNCMKSMVKGFSFVEDSQIRDYSPSQFIEFHNEQTLFLMLDSVNDQQFRLVKLEILLFPCNKQCQLCTKEKNTKCLECKENSNKDPNDPNNCICNEGYTNDSKGNCVKICPTKYIYNKVTRSCEKDYCSEKNYCKKCGDNNQCIQCENDKKLLQGECVSRCLNPYVKKDDICYPLNHQINNDSYYQYNQVVIKIEDYQDEFQSSSENIKENSNDVNPQYPQYTNLIPYFDCDNQRFYSGQFINSESKDFEITITYSDPSIITGVLIYFELLLVDTVLNNQNDPFQIRFKEKDIDKINELTQVHDEKNMCFKNSAKDHLITAKYQVDFINEVQPPLVYKIGVEYTQFSPWNFVNQFGIANIMVSLKINAPIGCENYNSPMLCYKCAQDFYLYNNVCYEKRCPMGSYQENSQQNICKPCPMNCQVCESVDKCLQCFEDYYAYNGGTCFKNNCPAGSYESYQSLYQRVCKIDCQSGYALDPNEVCIPCNINDGKCIINKRCKQCINNCQMCSNEKQCNQCYSGYYLSSDSLTCIKCPQVFCLQCNSTSCQVCDSTQNAINDFPNGTCQCKQGFFFDNTTSKCQKCDATCRTCINQATFCTSCNSNNHFFLSENKCLCQKLYELDMDDQTNCILILSINSIELSSNLIQIYFNRSIKSSEFQKLIISALGLDQNQLKFIKQINKLQSNIVDIQMEYDNIPIIKILQVQFSNGLFQKEINYIPINDSQRNLSTQQTSNQMNSIGSSVLDENNPLVKYVIHPLKYLQLLTYITNIPQIYSSLIFHRLLIPEEVYSISYFSASLIFKRTPTYTNININGQDSQQSIDFNELGMTYNLIESCQFQTICYLVLIFLILLLYLVKKIQTEFNYAQMVYSILLNYFAGNIQGTLMIVQLSQFYALQNQDKASLNFSIAVLFLISQGLLFSFLFIYGYKKNKILLLDRFSNLVNLLNIDNKFIRYYFPILIVKKYTFGVLAFTLVNKSKLFCIINIIIFFLNFLCYLKWRMFMNNILNGLKIVQELMISILFILMVVCISKKETLISQQFLTKDELSSYQLICQISFWFMITSFVFSISVNLVSYGFVIYKFVSSFCTKKQPKYLTSPELNFSNIQDTIVRKLTTEFLVDDQTYYPKLKNNYLFKEKSFQVEMAINNNKDYSFRDEL